MRESDFIGLRVGGAPAAADPHDDDDAEPKRNPGRGGGAVKRRFGLLNAVADSALPQIPTRAALAAWLLLFRHAKPDGTVVAGVADLARRAGCDVATTKRGLQRLQEAGLVERIKRGSVAGGASVWRLLTPEGGRP